MVQCHINKFMMAKIAMHISYSNRYLYMSEVIYDIWQYISPCTHVHRSFLKQSFIICSSLLYTRELSFRFLKTELLENSRPAEDIQKRCFHCLLVDRKPARLLLSGDVSERNCSRKRATILLYFNWQDSESTFSWILFTLYSDVALKSNSSPHIWFSLCRRHCCSACSGNDFRLLIGQVCICFFMWTEFFF